MDSVRLKAELDFDGRKITEIYLANKDLAEMLTVSLFYGNLCELGSGCTTIIVETTEVFTHLS